MYFFISIAAILVISLPSCLTSTTANSTVSWLLLFLNPFSKCFKKCKASYLCASKSSMIATSLVKPKSLTCSARPCRICSLPIIDFTLHGFPLLLVRFCHPELSFLPTSFLLSHIFFSLPGIPFPV